MISYVLPMQFSICFDVCPSCIVYNFLTAQIGPVSTSIEFVT